MIQIQKKDLEKHILQPKVFINLRMKLLLLIGALVIAIVAVIGSFLYYFVTDTLERQIGDRALDVAKSVALIPELQEAFRTANPASIIQPIVDPITKATEAEFIVVGNRDEIRYAHPNPDRIGEKMVGEDNERALLYGESYVSKATGSLGSSLRAKVPIRLDDEIVGVVSVGFLAHSIQSIIWDYNKELWAVLGLITVAAILGAAFIANKIKKLLYGLEPEEISHLLFQKETILHSIHEGIIAVDSTGRITMINSAAKRFLFNSQINNASIIGKEIIAVFPHSDLLEVLRSGQGKYDQEKLFGKHVIYVNTVPIYYEQNLVGAVSTFRNKTEIEQLTKELSHIKQYADALRAQTHEFSNKLYTILGLVHLNKKKEVMDLIQTETHLQQTWIHTLIGQVRDPLLSGLLLGKLNQVNEQQVSITIAPGSQLQAELSSEKRHALLTAIGNLIDNAIDSVQKQPSKEQNISIYFTDIGQDILFEVDDSGIGIQIQETDQLFKQGISTKEGNGHGFGLALTKQAIERAGGQLYVEESELGGACFVVSLPKDSKE